MKKFRSSLPPEAKMLEPVYLEFQKNTRLPAEGPTRPGGRHGPSGPLCSRVQPELALRSLFLPPWRNEMCETPIVGAGHHGRTLAAYLDSMGAEGYAEYAYGGLSKLMALLRARKVFRQTNMLLITDIGSAVKGPGYLRGSVRDFDDLKNKFGIGTAHGELQRAYRRTDKILKDPAAWRKVEHLGVNCSMSEGGVDRELFKNNVLFTRRSAAMAKYNCNAYSIRCIEFCSSKLPAGLARSPCVSFSLLSGAGYATAHRARSAACWQ